jgi:hypothetical protein
MNQLLTAVPVPRTDGVGWGIMCPVHRALHPDVRYGDAAHAEARALAAAVRCPDRSHITGEYSTGSANGMSFICNRWVYTGSEGYRVVPTDSGWSVYRYDATGSHPVYGGQGLTVLDAHRMAHRLANPRR